MREVTVNELRTLTGGAWRVTCGKCGSKFYGRGVAGKQTAYIAWWAHRMTWHSWMKSVSYKYSQF